MSFLSEDFVQNLELSLGAGIFKRDLLSKSLKNWKREIFFRQLRENVDGELVWDFREEESQRFIHNGSLGGRICLSKGCQRIEESASE